MSPSSDKLMTVEFLELGVELFDSLNLMIKSKRGTFLLVFVVVLMIGCKEQENPDFVNELIDSHADSNIRAVWSFRFNGDTVYYIQNGCCDMYNVLYDAHGEKICSPDGGITGSGDGRCPTFWDSAKRRNVIWERSQQPSSDPR